MSNTYKVTNKYTIGGKSFSDKSSVTGEDLKSFSKSIAAAKSGSLTTRTDANTGVLTMAAGHGITDGVSLDIYWTSGGQTFYRRGMTVGTVATNSVPIDGGSGTDLPAATTAIMAMIPIESAFVLVGDEDIQGFVLSCDADAIVQLIDVTDAVIATFFVLAAVPVEWHSGSNLTNPLLGLEPVTISMSHGASAAKTVDLHILYD